MKKLLFLIASSMPMGIAAMEKYKDPVIKEDLLCRDILRENYKPISVLKEPINGRKVYSEN